MDNIKQRITAEDLAQLSPEQKEKLREWWKPEAGDWFYGSYGGRGMPDEYLLSDRCTDMGFYGPTTEPDDDSMPDCDAIPQLSIGQMIEMLSNSGFCFPSIGLTESKNRCEYIVVGVTCLSGSKEFRGKTFEGENICDALWQAVKSIL